MKRRAGRACGAPRVRAGGDLSHLQRRLRRNGGRRLDAPAIVRGSAASGPHSRWLAPREPEAHGLVSLMELHASRAAARTTAAGEPVLLLERTVRAGSFLIQRGLRPWHVRKSWAARAVSTRCRRRSLHVMPARRRQRRRTGRGSPRCMPSLRRSRPRRSSSSIALSRWRWRRAQAGLDILDRLTEEPALKCYPSCPASAETSCSGLVGTARRALRSTMRQRSRPTAASATYAQARPGSLGCAMIRLAQLTSRSSARKAHS